MCKKLCYRPWNTLFCPIKTLQVAKDPLYANLYVDYISFGDGIAELGCVTPSNDGIFYEVNIGRL